MLTRSAAPMRRTQAGLSLVELLVGVAVGLFVVAGAAMLVATQLGENRRLLLETQLHQDLRATADIIAHELRRSGSMPAAESLVWSEVNPTAAPNPFAPITPDAGMLTSATYNYARTTAATSPSGFRLSASKVQTRLPGAVGWQDLTDGRSMLVTAFTVTARAADEPTPGGALPSRLPCPNLCPDNTTNCWPLLRVRELQIDIAAQAVADSSVQRSIRSIVRLRNDETRQDPAGLCPPAP